MIHESKSINRQRETASVASISIASHSTTCSSQPAFFLGVCYHRRIRVVKLKNSLWQCRNVQKQSDDDAMHFVAVGSWVDEDEGGDSIFVIWLLPAVSALFVTLCAIGTIPLQRRLVHERVPPLTFYNNKIFFETFARMKFCPQCIRRDAVLGDDDGDCDDVTLALFHFHRLKWQIFLSVEIPRNALIESNRVVPSNGEFIECERKFSYRNRIVHHKSSTRLTRLCCESRV